jgi:hypothetical protein
MTIIQVDAEHPLPKPTRIWGLGPIIGDRQTTIVKDSDYDDLPQVMEAIRSSFDANAHDEETLTSQDADGSVVQNDKENNMDIVYTPEDRNINVRTTKDSVGRPVSIQAEGRNSVIVMDLSENEAKSLRDALNKYFS